jgi:hypothetical protein
LQIQHRRPADQAFGRLIGLRTTRIKEQAFLAQNKNKSKRGSLGQKYPGIANAYALAETPLIDLIHC